MNLIYIFVVAWFLLSVLASNISSKKGYLGWLFFLASTVATIGVILIGAKAHNVEVAASVGSWLCPLLLVGVAFVLPARE